MKTSLAYLYVKATLCENREEGDYKPCGKCNSCLASIEKDEHPNVTYYRITEASLFKDVVSDLISISKSAPIINHNNNRDDNYRRFLIIDELQAATRQSISPFLDSLEFASEYTTIILISMDLSKLDSVVREAIESRCIELTLSKLTCDEITQRLFDKYPNIDIEVINLIAYLSKGNIRKAWSILEYFLIQVSASELTSEFILNQKAGGMNLDKCKTIINSLEKNTWENTASIINNIKDNEEQAIDYFISNFIKMDLTEEGLNLLSSLSFWLQSNYKIPLSSVFKLHQNKKLMNNTKTIKDKKTESNILKNLSNLTGKKVIIEKEKDSRCCALGFNKWSQFLDYYANNNN